MTRLILAILTLVLTSEAHAGAWPRGQGNGFVMASYQATVPQFFSGFGRVTTYSSLYGEYGLTDKLTLGFDIGHSVSGESKTLAFASYPLSAPESRSKLSVQFGLGSIGNNLVVRPGLSFGRGFDGKIGQGWASVDFLLEHHLGRGLTDIKADISLGLNHKGGFKSILQIQSGRQKGDPAFLRVAPSFALPMGRKTHLELGFTTELISTPAYGLRVGLWRDF